MKQMTLALLLSTGLLAGCVTAAGVRVPGPPPPVRIEHRGVAPAAAYVWVGGHWAWQRAAWVWTPGQWRRPPRGKRAWVAGRWGHKRHGWVWHEGHWR